MSKPCHLMSMFQFYRNNKYQPAEEETIQNLITNTDREREVLTCHPNKNRIRTSLHKTDLCLQL